MSTELLSIPGCQCSQIVGGQDVLLSEGPLSLLKHTDNKLSLGVGSSVFALAEKTPFYTHTASERIYLFQPSLTGTNADTYIKVLLPGIIETEPNGPTAKQRDELELILVSHGYLKSGTAALSDAIGRALAGGASTVAAKVSDATAAVTSASTNSSSNNNIVAPPTATSASSASSLPSAQQVADQASVYSGQAADYAKKASATVEETAKNLGRRLSAAFSGDEPLLGNNSKGNVLGSAPTSASAPASTAPKQQGVFAGLLSEMRQDFKVGAQELQQDLKGQDNPVANIGRRLSAVFTGNSPPTSPAKTRSPLATDGEKGEVRQIVKEMGQDFKVGAEEAKQDPTTANLAASVQNFGRRLSAAFTGESQGQTLGSAPASREPTVPAVPTAGVTNATPVAPTTQTGGVGSVFSELGADFKTGANEMGLSAPGEAISNFGRRLSAVFTGEPAPPTAAQKGKGPEVVAPETTQKASSTINEMKADFKESWAEGAADFKQASSEFGAGISSAASNVASTLSSFYNNTTAAAQDQVQKNLGNDAANVTSKIGDTARNLGSTAASAFTATSIPIQAKNVYDGSQEAGSSGNSQPQKIEIPVASTSGSHQVSAPANI